MIPVFVTSDYAGNVIDTKTPIIGQCHGDCGYSCSESSRLDTGLYIYSQLSAVHVECDDYDVLQNNTVRASIKEAHGLIDENSEIKYAEGENVFFKPDSMEISAMGFNSEVYFYEKDGFKQIVRLQIPSDSIVNYWIKCDSDLCSSSFFFGGGAKLSCHDCDYEIDEYQDLAYPTLEYFVPDSIGMITSIRIATDKSKLIVKGKNTEKMGDCIPVIDEVMLSKTR